MDSNVTPTDALTDSATTPAKSRVSVELMSLRPAAVKMEKKSDATLKQTVVMTHYLSLHRMSLGGFGLLRDGQVLT